MPRTTVALSALLPAKRNPRRRIDKTTIIGLAATIKSDGVLQNLIVEKAGDGKFRVVTGSRRYLALRLLRRQRVIDGDYKVPVEVRTFDGDDALRIATIENVQRADLDPIDESEAFARLLQAGGMIEDLSSKTGLSNQTIRKRLALSDLCKEVKSAVQKGELPLGIAEAMTLGTREQQLSLLKELRAGADLDRDQIREMLCAEKPSAVIAIFPLEKYAGTFTRDLFGEEETTYFDDVEQFLSLQHEAVEALAEQHRKKAPWVDVFNSYAAPWWQYREAEKGESAGVVINLKPNGRVEIKKRLVRHEVQEEVAEETKETPEAPKERPAISAGLIRYAALHKSVAIQAALLQNPRKAKEVVLVSLLLALASQGRMRLDVHPCVTAWDEAQKKPKAFTVIDSELSRLSKTLGVQFDNRRRLLMDGDDIEVSTGLYKAVQTLSDDDLDRFSVLLVLLSFGQSNIDVLDTQESLFNRVATDLNVGMREWWVPDVELLALMRKDRLEAVAAESGASQRISKVKGSSKKDLVRALSRYFENIIKKKTELSEHDQKGLTWLPGAMFFPSRIDPPSHPE